MKKKSNVLQFRRPKDLHNDAPMINQQERKALEIQYKLRKDLNNIDKKFLDIFFDKHPELDKETFDSALTLLIAFIRSDVFDDELVQLLEDYIDL